MKSALVIVAALLAVNALPRDASAATLASADRRFVNEALTDNSSEIRQGQVFADSSDTLVRSFAQRMTTDHSQANTQLIPLARKDHISVTGQLPNMPYGVTHNQPAWQSAQTKSKEMAGLPPVAYFTQQVRDHEQAVTLYRQEIAGGDNRAIVSYARATLPVIEAHLRLAQNDLRQERAKHHD